jgi:hypothetical protein
MDVVSSAWAFSDVLRCKFTLSGRLVSGTKVFDFFYLLALFLQVVLACFSFNAVCKLAGLASIIDACAAGFL